MMLHDAIRNAKENDILLNGIVRFIYRGDSIVTMDGNPVNVSSWMLLSTKWELLPAKKCHTHNHQLIYYLMKERNDGSENFSFDEVSRLMKASEENTHFLYADLINHIKEMHEMQSLTSVSVLKGLVRIIGLSSSLTEAQS